MKISEIVWDPSIYPRSKWNISTIDRYVDAMIAGDKFPALTIEKDTNRLLDGKHRMLAYEKAGIEEVPVEIVRVPDGLSVKYFAATLSSRHGDRLNNADVKILAESEFERDPTLDPKEWGSRLGLSKSTVYNYVSHILNRARASREEKAWRLSKLGWTQAEIGEKLSIDRSLISLSVKNSRFGKIHNDLGPNWNKHGVEDWANRTNTNLTTAWAAALEGSNDVERLERLEIKRQLYDVWNLLSCHDLMGNKYPGRIPGELIANILYYYTQPGDLVVDLMAGSGTTLDACLLLGRKGRGYDVNLHHNRIDIEKHNLNNGLPETVSKASLTFLDPPYYKKKEADYSAESVSSLDRSEYLSFFNMLAKNLYQKHKSNTYVAFLMSNYVDYENRKNSIWVDDYTSLFRDAGFMIDMQIQCPLSTQQYRGYQVNQKKEQKNLMIISREVVIFGKI
jgi:hypothetical protein